MAEKRMFAMTIIDSDAFLEMPLSAQSLYFHLSMRADDDGFINKPKAIMRAVKAAEIDIEALIEKKFILFFETEGIAVIKHWKISNNIRKDMYTETKYKELKSKLYLDENGAYTEHKPLQSCNEAVTEPLQDCNNDETNSLHRSDQYRSG